MPGASSATIATSGTFRPADRLIGTIVADSPEQFSNLTDNLFSPQVFQWNGLARAEDNFQCRRRPALNLLVEKPVEVQLGKDFRMVDVLGQLRIPNAPAVGRRQHEIGAANQTKGSASGLDSGQQLRLVEDGPVLVKFLSGLLESLADEGEVHEIRGRSKDAAVRVFGPTR